MMESLVQNLALRFDHQHCHYPLALDPYIGSCPYACSYCYARPHFGALPCTPADLDSFFSDLDQALKARPKNRLQYFLARRYPLRLGAFSDPLPPGEEASGHTLKLLKKLHEHHYPYTLITKSPLIAHHSYTPYLSPKLSAIQISLSFADDYWRKLIEPLAPSVEERLDGLEKLVRLGFAPTVRLNPLFPIYPDGTFSQNKFQDKFKDKVLPFFSLALFEKLQSIGVRHLVAGFASLSPQQVTHFKEVSGYDLMEWTTNSGPSFNYSNKEIIHYLNFLKTEALSYDLSLSACYLAGRSSLFSPLSALSDDPSDCCNLRRRFDFNLEQANFRPLTTRLFHSLLTKVLE